MDYIIQLIFIIIINVWETECISNRNPQHSSSSSIIRNFRHINNNNIQPLLINWEYGLRESANQALIREHYTDPNLRHHLQTAPFYGKEDRATPFGDVAILARGQLYITQHGYIFVQDPYQNDCDDCHNIRTKCGTNSCEIWKPNDREHLIALWTVKRLRHRQNGEYFYELEYTISPIGDRVHAGFITKNQRFDYNVPGHVFVIKSDTNYEKTAFEYEKIESGEESEEIYPTPPSLTSSHRFNVNGKHPHYGGIRPGILIGVTPEGHRYILQSYPTKTKEPSPIVPNSDEINVYKNLIHTLNAKTTKQPHRFSGPSEKYKPTAFIELNGQLIPVISSVTPPSASEEKTVFPVYPHKTTTVTTTTSTESEPDIYYGKLPPTEATRPSTTIMTQNNDKPLTTIHYFMPDVQEIPMQINKTTTMKPKTTTTRRKTTTTRRKTTKLSVKTTKLPKKTTPTTSKTTTTTTTTTKKPTTTRKKTTITTTRVPTTTTGSTKRSTTTRRRLTTTRKPSTIPQKPIKETSEEDIDFDDLFPTLATSSTATSKKTTTTTSKPIQTESFLESYEESAETTKQEINLRPPTTLKLPTKTTKRTTTTRKTTTTTQPTTITESFLEHLDSNETGDDDLGTLTGSIPTLPMRRTTTTTTTTRTTTNQLDQTEETRTTIPYKRESTQSEVQTSTIKRTTTPLTTLITTELTTEIPETTTTTTTNKPSTEQTSQETTKAILETTYPSSLSTIFQTTTTTLNLNTVVSTMLPTTTTTTDGVEELPTAAELLPTPQGHNDTTITTESTETTPEYVVTNIDDDDDDGTSSPIYYVTEPPPTRTSMGTRKTTVKRTEKDYDEDIFGKPPSTTKKPIIYVTQIRPDINDDVFGNNNKRKAKELRYKPTILRRRRVKKVQPKIIFSNFYQPSSTTPLSSTTDDFLTSQSYSTSISVEVNNNKRINVPIFDEKVQYESMVKAKLSKIGHSNGNFEIYKAELPESTEGTTSPKKEFDHIALQLVNHAKSIDYLNTKPPNITKKQKYRRRNYTRRSTTVRPKNSNRKVKKN